MSANEQGQLGGFLTLEQVVEAIDDQYGHYPVPGFVFEKSDLDETSLRELEHDLGVKICGSFRDLLLTYNFGNLTLGFVTFGTQSTNRVYLREENAPMAVRSDKDSNVLALGQTDGFTVLVDSERGTVFSLEAGSKSRELIACNLRRFLEAVGTLVLNREKAVSESVIEDLCAYCECQESSRFWRR